MPELGSYKLCTAIAVGSRTRLLSGIQQTLPLAHGFLAANDYGVGVVDDAVADGICQQRIGQLLRHPGMSNWEQKIVEFRLYRDSTIFNKSLASVSFRGYRSHSSMMSRAYRRHQSVAFHANFARTV